MKGTRLVLLVVLGVFILYVKVKTGGTNTSTPASTSLAAPANAVAPAVAPSAASASVPAATAPAETNGAIPQKAITVLQYVRQNGQAPEGYVGGRVFENRENRLPGGGDYREFDVDPHNGQRNAERLIVEWSTKKAWYTGDHYQTFIPMP
jgi:ribonuclease T1